MQNIPNNALLRLPQVLALIPVSRSAWWAGCKSGRYPKPVKLGPRTTAWRAADIAALLEKLTAEPGEKRNSFLSRLFVRHSRMCAGSGHSVKAMPCRAASRALTFML